jgi:hypothetical protein
MRTSFIILGSLQMISFFGDYPATISFEKSVAEFTETKLNIIACDSLPHEIIRNDLKKFYDEYDVDGMFVLFDSRKKEYTFYDKSLLNSLQLPRLHLMFYLR